VGCIELPVHVRACCTSMYECGDVRALRQGVGGHAHRRAMATWGDVGKEAASEGVIC
jgi:hypothetical protein